jgi:choline kinase
MHCVILAAGTATRLRPLTDETPKCLLTVGSQTILERTVNAVLHAHVRDCTIVTGFEEKKIRTFIAEKFPSLSVRFVANTEYASTNNAYSLLLARPDAGGTGMLLMDSDILFDESIVSLLMQSKHRTCLAVRTVGEIGGEEIKVKTNPAREVVEIGKHVTPESAYGESIGIEKFSPGDTERLFDTLRKRVTVENRRMEYYEASFQEMIDTGSTIFAEDVGTRRCIEVDTADDLRRAELMFAAR